MSGVGYKLVSMIEHCFQTLIIGKSSLDTVF